MGQAEHLQPLPTVDEAPRRTVRVQPSRINGDDLVEQAQQAFNLLRAGAALTAPLPVESDPLEPDPEPLYATGFGQVSFAELYTSTQRIAGSVLRDQLGMRNPEDIDDCLQAGYLKVWQKLQQDPDWFADKPKRYLVQAVVLHSKAQRYSHLRHYRKLVYDAEPEIQGGGSELSETRVETWMDLQQALGRVAAAVEDQPVVLLALYNLITQVKQQDVAKTFGCGVATLGKYQRQLRATLAEALDGYGPRLATSGLPLPPRLMQADVGRTPSVAQVMADWRQREPTSLPIPRSGRTMTAEVVPALSEAQITHPSVMVPEARFPTGWGGALTLEQILTDPAVNRSAYAKARRLGLEEADVADCVQQGSIKLWQKLQTQPALLVDKGPVWAGTYLAYSGDPKSFHRHYHRRRRFDDPEFDWDAADEYLALGVEQKTPWTQTVDERLDLAWFMSLAAARYVHEPRKLLALYALTTTVLSKDVASVVGLHPKNYAAAIGNPVKREVRTWWADYFRDVSSANPMPGDGLD